MQEIVINDRHGGFGLSREAILLARKLSGNALWGGPCILGDYYEDGTAVKKEYGSCRDVARDDKVLVAVVKQLGEKANYDYSTLLVVEIPDDVEWVLKESDGAEWIAEKHRTWP